MGRLSEVRYEEAYLGREEIEISSCFYSENTIDGENFLINLQNVQMASVLWKPTPLPVDATRYDGETIIAIKNRQPFGISTDKGLHDNLWNTYFDTFQFLEIQDMDDETHFINTKELLFIETAWRDSI